MTASTTHPLIRCIRRLAAADLAGLSDEQLLERFASRRDEAAFAALVRLHGPLVLGACRRLLHDSHAADDCFQEAFLVLARKAGTLKNPEALGPWLYGVACRTARKARARAARRCACEQRAALPEAITQPNDQVWSDLRPVLDAAVAALPETYRTPFVLHYLQGATVSEVARRLNWPRGTVATRLARARERLRVRLARQGLTLAVGMLSQTLLGRAACAGVPAALRISTARAAMAAASEAVAAGGIPAATALEQGGEKVMWTTKVKIAAMLVLAVGLAGGGAALSGQRTPAPAKPPTEGVGVPNPQPSDREADWALFFRGSTHFLLGDYRAAVGPFSRLAEAYPDSPVAPTAAELAVLARRLTDAEDGSGRKAAEGRRLIEAALARHGRSAAPPTDDSGRAADELRRGQAEKDFRMAEFYRRTGHAGTAYFYYELVCRRYPRTEWAARATERLGELRKKADEGMKAEQRPARVGQIIVVGNTKTEQSVILEQLQLYPGQVLTPAELRAAERRLERLDATVSVIDSEGSDYKDILIRVREK
jgi:RNA polymerase sigma factor (sigma-70 family)